MARLIAVPIRCSPSARLRVPRRVSLRSAVRRMGHDGPVGVVAAAR
jgi:hypothetical protein